MSNAPLLVDGERLLRRLNELAEFGKNLDGGVSRVAYSDFDKAAREYLIDLLESASLETRIDAAGNIIGKLPGLDPSLPSIATGSHVDTVMNGGNYDGCVGAMSAIELAQTLADFNITLQHTLEIIIFQNEEQGLFGSRAIVSGLTEADLDQISTSGKTIREGIGFIGGDVSQLASARREPGEITAFIEYHIEQGPILDSNAINIGIVTGIVAVHRWNVTISGEANHAGTTPMNARKDALLAAAEFIRIVNRVVTSMPGNQVGTVGKINAVPNVVNVIPGEVSLTLEIRDLDILKVQAIYDEIYNEAVRIENDTGITFRFVVATTQPPALTEERIRDFIEDACNEFSFTFQYLQSGAGHDSQAMAQIAPIGMIFIPSLNGISHSPQEFSQPDDIINGANIHLSLLLKIDQELRDHRIYSQK